jgi:hypothetical protein
MALEKIDNRRRENCSVHRSGTAVTLKVSRLQEEKEVHDGGDSIFEETDDAEGKSMSHRGGPVRAGFVPGYAEFRSTQNNQDA